MRMSISVSIGFTMLYPIGCGILRPTLSTALRCFRTCLVKVKRRGFIGDVGHDSIFWWCWPRCCLLGNRGWELSWDQTMAFHGFLGKMPLAASSGQEPKGKRINGSTGETVDQTEISQSTTHYITYR